MDDVENLFFLLCPQQMALPHTVVYLPASHIIFSRLPPAAEPLFPVVGSILANGLRQRSGGAPGQTYAFPLKEPVISPASMNARSSNYYGRVSTTTPLYAIGEAADRP